MPTGVTGSFAVGGRSDACAASLPVALVAALVPVVVGATLRRARSTGPPRSQCPVGSCAPTAPPPPACQSASSARSLGDLGGRRADHSLISLFTACLVDPPGLCRDRKVRRTTTAADGTYPSSSRERRPDRLRQRPDHGRTGRVPPAQVRWLAPQSPPASRSRPRTSACHLRCGNRRSRSVRVGSVGRPLAGADSYQVGMEDARGHSVWILDSRWPDVTFDARILEDTAGSLAVSAGRGRRRRAPTVEVLHRSARVATAAPPARRRHGAGPAPQRGHCRPMPPDRWRLQHRPPGSPATTTTTSVSAEHAAATPTDSLIVDLGGPGTSPSSSCQQLPVPGRRIDRRAGMDAARPFVRLHGRRPPPNQPVPATCGSSAPFRTPGGLGVGRHRPPAPGTDAVAGRTAGRGRTPPTRSPLPRPCAPAGSIALAALLAAAIAARRRRPPLPPLTVAGAAAPCRVPATVLAHAAVCCPCSSRSWRGRRRPARSP